MNKLDDRYTIELENVGFSQPRYVPRFCGEYLGQSRLKQDAISIAKNHMIRRLEDKI